METDQFLRKMNELLDTEQEVSMQTRLMNLEEWDSLSFVTFLAMYHDITGKMGDVEKVKQAETIGDLFYILNGGGGQI